MTGVRVLLVEDCEPLARIWSRQLGAAGHVVHWTATLDATRAFLARGRCDVIVLDLVLPDGDGESLARDLRARGGGIPIVVVSAHIDAERALSLANLCVVALPKPLGCAHLVAGIARALDCHRDFGEHVEAFAALYRLSARETDVVRASALGLSGEAVVAELDATPATIATYWHRVFAKTKANAKTEVLAGLARFIHDRVPRAADTALRASPSPEQSPDTVEERASSRRNRSPVVSGTFPISSLYDGADTPEAETARADGTRGEPPARRGRSGR